MSFYYYELGIYKKPAKYSGRDRFIIEEKHLLAENDRYIVFNDMSFTKIEKSGDGICWSKLNKPSISFRTCLNEQGIFYRLYSNCKIRPSTIETQIRKKANDEYGYLFSQEIDLNILKKPEIKP